MDLVECIGLGVLIAGIVKFADIMAGISDLWSKGEKDMPSSRWFISFGLITFGILLIAPTLITFDNAPWFMVGMGSILYIAFGTGMLLRYQDGIKRRHRASTLLWYNFKCRHKHLPLLIICGGMWVCLCLFVIILGVLNKASVVGIGGGCLWFALLSMAFFILVEALGYTIKIWKWVSPKVKKTHQVKIRKEVNNEKEC